MRDIVITLLIGGLLPFALWRPYYGAYLWAWITLMIPHRSAYGFARTLPFSQMIAMVTLLGLLNSRYRRPFPVSAITMVQVTFLLWMSFTCLFALNDKKLVIDQWIVVLKTHCMIFATLMLLRGRNQIEMLIWIATLSIGFYGVKGGLWTLLTGGGGRVWGPTGGMIQGNNELGVALVMVIPFMYYLRQIAPKAWLRHGMSIGIAFVAVGILGTQSRGALLGLLSMAFVLGLKGKNPIGTSLVLVILIGVAIAFMPDSWTQRMDTIQSYQEDGSAMSRIYTWITLWNVALDRPLVGAGFRTDSIAVFMTYAPVGGVGSYQDGGIFVAHSIYFQALGEHGFVGLFLFLLLGFVTWRRASVLATRAKALEDYRDWVPLLMRMVQVSLIGYAAGGAFLTLVHFDLPYYVIAYVILVEATMKEKGDLPSRRPYTSMMTTSVSKKAPDR